MFELSSRTKFMQKLFRDFAVNEVEPIAAEVDETERFPIENVELMAKAGFLGVPFPKEYGGAGGTDLEYAILVEELSKVCATTGVIVSAHTSLCCWPIFKFGSEEQKQRYLPDLLSGKKLGAFALTEAFAGTDSASQQTKAEKVEGGYSITGSKIFITNAQYADVFIVFAMTDRSKGNRGISAFIVDRDAEGFEVGKPENKMGIRGSATCELIFKDCFVPEENLLDKEGKGFKVAMMTLDGGRIGIAAQALGIAQGAIDKTIEYTKERQQFGRSIAKFQNTQFQVADMIARTEASRMLVYKAAANKTEGRPYGVDAAIAKLFAAECAMAVTTKAVQLYGGYGYTREYPVERMMRDAKITEIYEGTSEVQRMVIAANAYR